MLNITWAEWYMNKYREIPPNVIALETNRDCFIKQWEANHHYNDAKENGVDVVLDNDSYNNDNDSNDTVTNNHHDSMDEKKDSVAQKNLNKQKNLNDQFDKLVVSKSKTNVLELVLQ